MSKVIVTKEKLDSLANSISNKSGESTPLSIDDMIDAIDGIQIGGSVTITDVPNATGITCVITTNAEPEPTPTPSGIPLNTELIDYTKMTSDTAINQNGEAFTEQWYYTSDYTAVDPSMTFSYTASYWFYIGLYDSTKTAIGVIYGMTDGTQDPSDTNTGHGTLSGNKLPSNVAYVRLCGTAPNSTHISLIRTA